MSSPAPEYRIYRLGEQPVFAVSNYSAATRLAGLRRYQPFTRRRTLYRRGLTVAICARLDRFISEQTSTPTALFPFDQWLEDIRMHFGEPNASAAIFWPPQINRKRLYVHLFDAALNGIGFAKISLDSSNDLLLAREADTLIYLATLGLQNSCVPKVLMQQNFLGHEVLLTEALPPDALPLGRQAPFPQAAVNEFAEESMQISICSLDQLSWWPLFVSAMEPNDEWILDSLSTKQSNEMVAVTLCHGDFSFANMVQTSDTLWIFDWEVSCSDAPANVDALSFELERRCLRAGARSAEARSRIEMEYVDSVGPVRLAEALMGLAYLRTVRRPNFTWLGNGEGVAYDG